MTLDFVVGQTYNRRRDIHLRFGGQRQSGIVTPADYPAIFVFTGRGRVMATTMSGPRMALSVISERGRPAT